MESIAPPSLVWTRLRQVGKIFNTERTEMGAQRTRRKGVNSGFCRNRPISEREKAGESSRSQGADSYKTYGSRRYAGPQTGEMMAHLSR